jgi:hypothetical protein
VDGNHNREGLWCHNIRDGECAVYKTGSKGSQADHNALVMKYGQAPGLFWSGNDKLLLDCHACNSKDEIARTAQIGPIHIELKMP